MADDVLLIDEPRPGVRRLVLNRPNQRNALNLALLRALDSALADLADEEAPRVVVLEGAGPVFCAGLDLKEAADASLAEQSATLAASIFTRLLKLTRCVTLCKADGAAIGGGVGLLLACDLAIVDDQLTLSFPELQRGIVPALVAVLLRRKVGDGVVRSLLLAGRPMSAAEAMTRDLVHEVIASDSLDRATAEWIDAVLTGGPVATQLTKVLLNRLTGDVDAAISLALETHLRSRNSAEFAEGAAAFREKRSPAWAARQP